MTPEQEIKAKALELAVKTLALLPEQKRLEQFKNCRPEEAIIQISLPYFDHLKDRPN